MEEAEQNIGGQLPIGLDHGDYPVMAAPTPSLVLAATRDFFDITGTRATAAEAKRLCGLLGRAERMEIAERDVEHGFGQPLREAALAWMNRWLKENPAAPAETPPQLLSHEQLHCTLEGNVYRAGLGKTTMDLIADGDLDEAMRGKIAADALARGMRMLAISVRGTGESAPKVRLNEQLAPLFGQDWQEALFGVLLDRSLLGQKVHDALAVIAWANETYGPHVPIHLHGRAATGPVALHAAVRADAERKIAVVTLADSLASWRSLVQARFHDRELANVVPGALVHYDLPDLAAALGDRLTTDRAGRRTP